MADDDTPIDPLEEFEAGMSPAMQQRIFALKMAQSILSDRDMTNHERISMEDAMTLADYILNGSS